MATLLIVDDNKQNLALMRDFTESWGYTVLTSMHGIVAVEMTKKQQPDAILLDIMLPGMSGYEVCKELKENKQTADIPVIMVTALMDIEDRIHGLKLGADYFLSKPLPYNELKVVLENLINKKNQMEANEKCFAVVTALTKLAEACFVRNNLSVQKDMLFYVKKIVELMHFDKKVEERSAVAAMLHITGIFADRENTKIFLASIEGLKLSSWLKPVVLGITEFTAYSNVEVVEEANKSSVNIMTVLIAYFSALETLKSKEDVLALLQNKQIYDEKILKTLNKVVNDKKLLDFLNTEY